MAKANLSWFFRGLLRLIRLLRLLKYPLIIIGILKVYKRITRRLNKPKERWDRERDELLDNQHGFPPFVN